MIVRAARPDDVEAIRAVVAAAFGRSDEAAIVEAVRAEQRVLAELAAEADGVIVGHVLFSRMSADAAALVAGLAPLSVTPARRRQGIGAALVERGLAACAAAGALGCIVLGSPAYYGRFGFSRAPETIACRYASLAAFQALAFSPAAFAQPIRLAYPAAFD